MKASSSRRPFAVILMQIVVGLTALVMARMLSLVVIYNGPGSENPAEAEVYWKVVRDAATAILLCAGTFVLLWRRHNYGRIGGLLFILSALFLFLRAVWADDPPLMPDVAPTVLSATEKQIRSVIAVSIAAIFGYLFAFSKGARRFFQKSSESPAFE